MAERGHRVDLWEAASALGGQFAVAGKLRIHRDHYPEWVQWQAERLDRLGVDVSLGRTATAEAVLADRPDLVAIATGATPRLPLADGLDQPHVMTAYDVARGAAEPSGRVVLISEDDRSLPLAVADHMAANGLDVTVVHSSLGPSPLVSKYTIGAILARLDASGVRTIASTRLTRVEGKTISLAHIYSGREWQMTGVDSVVLACGSTPQDGLYHQLSEAGLDVHVLGDAYAPRRAAFATLQALELAELLSPAGA
jgi:NADPH-dependent 2,4-dienoyl-CoA reductase/sulfur reductase-like enzyme